MHFGVGLPQYGKTVSPEDLGNTLQLAEQLGFHSVWVSDHVITPSHLLPRIGPTFYDAFVVLSYAAALTQRVKLGSSVVVVPYRNALVVAKMVATLDVLSQGRVIFGVGAGGAPDEFAALGVPSRQRGRRTDEYLRLMVALWTQDPTTFQGRYFSFSDVRFQPKPVQKPHPPIWVGGHSEAALRRAVALGAAWHPTALPLPALAEKVRHLRLLAAEAGRAAGPAVTVHQGIRLEIPPSPLSERHVLSEAEGGAREDFGSPERRMGQGTTQQLREDVQHYLEMGVSAIICNFAAATVPELWRAMETFAAEVMAFFPEPG
jgi:probable F420-dependent oxidoreductase